MRSGKLEVESKVRFPHMVLKNENLDWLLAHVGQSWDSAHLGAYHTVGHCTYIAAGVAGPAVAVADADDSGAAALQEAAILRGCVPMLTARRKSDWYIYYH
jgi:hypothetical protein